MTLAGNTSIRTQFMDDLDLLIDLHVRNARQAPGSDESTQQAITLARLAKLHILLRGWKLPSDETCSTPQEEGK